MKRKFAAALLLSALSMSSLAGCSQNENSQPSFEEPMNYAQASISGFGGMRSSFITPEGMVIPVQYRDDERGGYRNAFALYNQDGSLSFLNSDPANGCDGDHLIACSFSESVTAVQFIQAGDSVYYVLPQMNQEDGGAALEVVTMKLDGSGRKVLFSEPWNLGNTSPFLFAAHQGKLYFHAPGSTELTEFDVASGKKETLFTFEENQEPDNIFLAGDQGYIHFPLYQGKTGVTLNWTLGSDELSEWKTNTKMAYIGEDSSIYYADQASWLDQEGQDPVKLVDTETGHFLVSDDYIAWSGTDSTGQDGLKLFDRNGNLLSEAATDSGETLMALTPEGIFTSTKVYPIQNQQIQSPSSLTGV